MELLIAIIGMVVIALIGVAFQPSNQVPVNQAQVSQIQVKQAQVKQEQKPEFVQFDKWHVIDTDSGEIIQTKSEFLRYIDEGNVDIPQYKQEVTDGHLNGVNIVITGITVKDRSDLIKLANSVGAKVATRVSGKTSYLVLGKHDRSVVKREISNKHQEALTRGLKIISESEFINLVRN